MKCSLIADIEKSGTGIEKSGTGMKRLGSLGAMLLGFVLMSFSAIAVHGDGTGSHSEGGQSDLSISAISISKDLVTVNFRDGYKVVSGYGYLEEDYSKVSLYSLEYVYVIGSDGESDGQSLFVHGDGTGVASEGTNSETAPVHGDGTGTASEGSNNNQQLKAWGIAEVVLSERGIADIIVYRIDDEGALEEVGVYSGVEVH